MYVFGESTILRVILHQIVHSDKLHTEKMNQDV